MVLFLAVGRLKAGPERQLFERYVQRSEPLARRQGFGLLETAELRESAEASSNARKRAEAEAILARIPDRAAALVLDERGKNPTTQTLADWLANWRDDGRAICLVIGGPDGLDEKVRSRADQVIGFGAMTLPHQLVRVLAAEQLYRVLTLLEGHPYHRA